MAEVNLDIRQMADNGGTEPFAPITVPQAVLFEDGNTMMDVVGNFAQIEKSPAVATHVVGDWIVWNGILYEVTASIAVNQSLVVGTNIQQTSVADLKSDLTSYIDISGSDILSGVYARKYTLTGKKAIFGYAQGISLNSGNTVFRNFVIYDGRPMADSPITAYSSNGLVNAYISASCNLVIYSASAQSNTTIFLNGEYY